jgi:type IV fimbrial biogenesis protein FimT
MPTHLSQRHRRTRRALGYSLIELVVVVAITGILAAIAAPRFVSAIESNRRTILSNQLMEDLALARSQAITLGRPVGLCGSGAQDQSCASVGQDSVTNWSAGWYLYAGNATTITTVIRDPQAVPSGWVVDAHLGAMSYVSINPRSRLSGIGHFTIYRSGSKTAACVTVSDTGRARAFTASVTSGVVGPTGAQDPC